jgi:predicted small lipoprotein YifL
MSPAAQMPRSGRPIGLAARIVVVLFVATLLAGCGKKGLPQPPPDEPNTYPRAYPHE